MAFCPRCASPNIDSAVACAMCGASLGGSVGTPPPPQPQAQNPYGGAPNYGYGGYGGGMVRTSGLAIGGFVCGLLGILCFLIAIVGLIMSVIAYNQCKTSQGELRGQGFAIAGIVLSIVWLVINAIYWIVVFSR
jgi:uncharacterized membrane protein